MAERPKAGDRVFVDGVGEGTVVRRSALRLLIQLDGGDKPRWVADAEVWPVDQP